MIVLRIVFGLVAFVTYLFLFWKRTKDDVLPNAVFTSSLYVLVGTAIGSLVAYYFQASMMFWIALVGSAVGFLIGKFRYNLPTVESVEALGISLLSVFAFIHLDGVLRGDMIGLIWFFVGFGMLFLFVILDANYKKLTWYKSGRIGFAGFTVFGLFFLIRAILASFTISMLSLVSPYDVYLSGLASILCFSVVFYLSRKT